MTASHRIENLRFAPKEKNLFFPTVRKRVDQYFAESGLDKTANTEMKIKAVVLLGSYIGAYLLLISQWIPIEWTLLVWGFMGIVKSGVGMSVMHDANHGAFSKKQKINDWIGQSINLLGGSVYNWKLQHNILHHTYTNIASHDEDIKNRAALRFSPAGKNKPSQKYQHIYAFFFYSLITLYWVVAKDLVQLIGFSRSGVNKNTFKENIILFIKMTFDKFFYFLVFLVIPIWVVGMPAGWVVGGFLFMHFLAGLILTLIFQMAHTVEGTDHPVANADGVIENDWAIHQMNTTMNFSRDNKLLSWYLGGLNYQVEHHLFPKICHVHYPALSHIVKATAEEFGVPYLENKTFGQALASHLRYLKTVGTMPDWNEAIA